MKKIIFFFLPLVLTGASFALQRSIPLRPNIVFLFADDMGQADISYRRDKFDISNIDRLAADGVTFTDAYTASPCCSPSRASAITGQHPARLMLVRHIPAQNGKEFHVSPKDPAQMPSRNWLPLETTTYAEALKTLGYKTAFIGKWHLGPESKFPNRQGFDEIYGVTEAGHPRNYYPPFFKSKTVYANAPKDAYLTDLLTDDAVAYIRRQDGSKPFCLTLFYYAVHTPHVGRKDLVEKLQSRGFEKEELHHAAMMEAVDESVGRIRAALLEKGLTENTVIVFSGDQGGLFDNSPMRGGKPAGMALFEGGARIPFIVCWPGVIKPGSKVSVPVSTLDLFPTFVQMAGGDLSIYENLDGQTLLPLLMGKKQPDRREIFMYRSYDPQYAAIRCGDWKLIAYRDGRKELYNLKNDLSEQNDLSASNPVMLKKLTDLLMAWEKRTHVYKSNQKR